MRTTRYTIGVLCSAALMACSPESNGSLTAPDSQTSVGSTALSVGSAAGVSVSTGINFTVPPEVFGFEVGNVLAVSGRKLPGGSVLGSFNYHQTFLGQTFKFVGSVTCLNVYDGNRAKVGGVVEVSNDPDVPVGAFLWWQNIDNGEGAGATDRSTLAGLGDEAANEAFCNDPAPPRFGPFDVQGGNIQVRDN